MAEWVKKHKKKLAVLLTLLLLMGACRFVFTPTIYDTGSEFFDAILNLSALAPRSTIYDVTPEFKKEFPESTSIKEIEARFVAHGFREFKESYPNDNYYSSGITYFSRLGNISPRTAVENIKPHKFLSTRRTDMVKFLVGSLSVLIIGLDKDEKVLFVRLDFDISSL